MGIGDWGLGIGDWGLGPIPNPQSPIPNPAVNKTINIINNSNNNTCYNNNYPNNNHTNYVNNNNNHYNNHCYNNSYPSININPEYIATNIYDNPLNLHLNNTNKLDKYWKPKRLRTLELEKENVNVNVNNNINININQNIEENEEDLDSTNFAYIKTSNTTNTPKINTYLNNCINIKNRKYPSIPTTNKNLTTNTNTTTKTKLKVITQEEKDILDLNTIDIINTTEIEPELNNKNTTNINTNNSSSLINTEQSIIHENIIITKFLKNEISRFLYQCKNHTYTFGNALQVMLIEYKMYYIDIKNINSNNRNTDNNNIIPKRIIKHHRIRKAGEEVLLCECRISHFVMTYNIVNKTFNLMFNASKKCGII